jgi:AraC family transcriptional regulator
MDADIYTIYESDFYRIMDFRCRCTDCRTSKPEYNAIFCISFVRKGNFLFNVFRRSLDSYTGCVLVTKPNYERTVTHTHDVPDECTIFEFKNDFFAALLEHYGAIPFFQDNDWHSTLIKTNAEMEFLHFHIIKLVLTRSGSKLQIDNGVIEVIEKVLSNITDYKPDHKINPRLKKNHLITLERAKEYMANHFTEDISLLQIATHCFVSPFHFSRLFKTFTSVSPHQYLLTLRLKNAELLLRNTAQPMADIAFTSGFNSVEHFTAAFKQKYSCPPATYRQQVETTSLK